MRGYKVVIDDGPAKGWGYTVSVPPDPVIAVAPMPEGASHVHGNWMRVVVGDDWPGVRRYEREELPLLLDAPPEGLVTSDGDLVCRYRVIE